MPSSRATVAGESSGSRRSRARISRAACRKPERGAAFRQARRQASARQQRQSGGVGDFGLCARNVRRVPRERLELRHQRPQEGRGAVQGLGEQVVGPRAEQQLGLQRDPHHAEIEAFGAHRRAGVGQVGVIDDEVALAYLQAGSPVGVHQPRPAHLQANAQALAGDPRDVSAGAADLIGRGAHVRDSRAADRNGVEAALEIGPPLARQLDRYAEHMPPANLAPVVEAVPRVDVVGREVQHGHRRRKVRMSDNCAHPARLRALRPSTAVGFSPRTAPPGRRGCLCAP